MSVPLLWFIHCQTLRHIRLLFCHTNTNRACILNKQISKSASTMQALAHLMCETGEMRRQIAVQWMG